MVELAETTEQVNHAAQKVRPGHTTFAAWCKWPMRDSNWRLLHQQRLHHEWISSCKAKSLSSGRRATWAMESNSMPKTSKQEDGPIHLSGWRGSPNTLQAANDFAILSSHWLDSGGPAVMKSSKQCIKSEMLWAWRTIHSTMSATELKIKCAEGRPNVKAKST